MRAPHCAWGLNELHAADTRYTLASWLDSLWGTPGAQPHPVPPYLPNRQLGSHYLASFQPSLLQQRPLGSSLQPPALRPAEETGLAVGSGPTVASRHPGKVHGPGNGMVLKLATSVLPPLLGILACKMLRLTVSNAHLPHPPALPLVLLKLSRARPTRSSLPTPGTCPSRISASVSPNSNYGTEPLPVPTCHRI